MSRLLHVSASPNGAASHSRRVGNELIAGLCRRHGYEVIERDLAAVPLPCPGPAFMRASLMAEAARGPTEAAALTVSERLVAELEETASVVIDTPMHNFSVPAALKAWIDYVVRPNRTFRSSRAGKVGLLRDRPVYVVIACGGGFEDAEGGQHDYLTPYLRYVLSTMGLRDVHTVRLERLGRGEAAQVQARASAAAWVGRILAGGGDAAP